TKPPSTAFAADGRNPPRESARQPSLSNRIRRQRIRLARLRLDKAYSVRLDTEPSRPCRRTPPFYETRRRAAPLERNSSCRRFEPASEIRSAGCRADTLPRSIARLHTRRCAQQTRSTSA